ncbi:MAG: DUF3365 domain-containing protein [Deltaproteobacteria bacterium]|nr:DUF3365 domain-containing protein [Deltaproteobacteria bacterium]
MENRSLCLLAGALLAAASALGQEQDRAERVATARAAAKDLGTALRRELQTSVEAGGAVAALDVCKTRAPALAAERSRGRPFQIGRTSLRVRNPSNAPDEWERKTLTLFESRKAKGEDPARMEHYEVVTQSSGRRWFRYLKPIVTEPMCLRCHADALEKDVAARLRVLYPDDRAMGFKTGDIRGAFTFRQPL